MSMFFKWYLFNHYLLTYLAHGISVPLCPKLKQEVCSKLINISLFILTVGKTLGGTVVKHEDDYKFMNNQQFA